MSMGKLRKPAKRRLSKDSYGFGRLEKEIQAFEENLRFAQDGLDSSLSCCYTNLIIKRRKRPG